MKFFIFFTSFFCMYTNIHCQVKLTEDTRSFTHAEKEGRCVADSEIVLFERDTGIPGVLTEQWFTGNDCMNNNSLIRYYIDDEVEPSIEGYLYMMHGIAFVDALPGNPWGTKWVGCLASGGGLYNTIRFPYNKRIRVTLQAKKSGLFWFILRGMENYPVIIGDNQLPSNARLRLSKIEKKTYPSFQFLSLANSTKNALIFMVNIAGESKDFNYLEGCLRILHGNNTQPSYLSSGTEDFFLSAYYYNEGMYQTDHSGLTYLKHPGTMSAYKIFADDPLIVNGGFHLLWRISETLQGYRCQNEICKVFQNDTVTCTSTRDQSVDTNEQNAMFADTKISTYVWYYEW